MKIELIRFGLTLALLVPVKAAAAESPKSTAPEPIEVTRVRPMRGEIYRLVTLPGEIKPFQQATLYAKVTGYLKTITVDKGDAVKEGALVAEIEAPELIADAVKFKAEAEVAELDHRRITEAQKKSPDLVVPLTVDAAKGKYEVAKASLERANTLLQFTRITAPFSGIVTRRMADPGAFVPAATAGNPQNAALVTVSDFNKIRLQIAVPELEASHIAKGQPVRFSVEGLPGKTFEGTITRFTYALDDASRTMLAEAEVTNPKLELRPGMYAIAKIGIERKAGALLAPVASLVMEKANAFVFIQVDGKAKKAPVKVGFNDGTNFEIASGIGPEQPVLVPGKRPLADGQPVKVTEAR